MGLAKALRRNKTHNWGKEFGVHEKREDMMWCQLKVPVKYFRKHACGSKKANSLKQETNKLGLVKLGKRHPTLINKGTEQRRTPTTTGFFPLGKYSCWPKIPVFVATMVVAFCDGGTRGGRTSQEESNGSARTSGGFKWEVFYFSKLCSSSYYCFQVCVCFFFVGEVEETWWKHVLHWSAKLQRWLTVLKTCDNKNN